MNTGKSIRIYGEVVGDIWMPQVECRKEFDWKLVRIPRDQDTRTAYSHGWPAEISELRDILLHVTNDGDFQSCSIDWAVIEVTLHKGNKRITRSWAVRGMGYNADCFLEGNAA